MTKDRNVTIRVNSHLWESFKGTAIARNISAANAIGQLMADYINAGDMPSQCLVNDLSDSLGNDLATRLGNVEERLTALENAKAGPAPRVAIAPTGEVSRNRQGKINVTRLCSQLETNDATLAKWIRGAVSDSPERQSFDRWCESHPEAHQELIDRFLKQ